MIGMRLIITLLLVVALVPQVSAWTWDKVGITSQSVTSVAVGGGNYELVARLVGARPMACTIVQFQDKFGTTLSPSSNYIVPRATSVAGKQTWDFRLMQFPDNQVVKVSCTDSCGDGVCQGDEQSGTTIGGTSCPIDCGCPGGQVFSWQRYWASGGVNVCVPSCPEVPYSTGWVRYCNNNYNQAGGTEYVSAGCQLQLPNYPVCYECTPGSFASSKTSGCNNFIAGDGICRGDLGEPAGTADCQTFCRYGSCTSPGTTFDICQDDQFFMDWYTYQMGYFAPPKSPDVPDDVITAFYQTAYCDASYCYTSDPACIFDYASQGLAQ